VVASHGWYDLSVSGEQFERHFAGRMETGAPSFSDPAV
jgi:phospholipase C